MSLSPSISLGIGKYLMRVRKKIALDSKPLGILGEKIGADPKPIGAIDSRIAHFARSMTFVCVAVSQLAPFTK